MKRKRDTRSISSSTNNQQSDSFWNENCTMLSKRLPFGSLSHPVPLDEKKWRRESKKHVRRAWYECRIYSNTSDNIDDWSCPNWMKLTEAIKAGEARKERHKQKRDHPKRNRGKLKTRRMSVIVRRSGYIPTKKRKEISTNGSELTVGLITKLLKGYKNSRQM